MQREITVWRLEMTSPDELRPSRAVVEGLRIEKAGVPCPELSRFLYTAVGGDWFWIDRLGWTYDQWLDYLDRPEHETWVASLAGNPVGYFELEAQAGGAVELAYFGLLPQFIGRGIGGVLLTAAIERAWAMGASRVWVHTCSLDGPAALPGYQARGFRLVYQETITKEFPSETPGPWPGSRRAGDGTR